MDSSPSQNAAAFSPAADDVFTRIAGRYDFMCDIFSVYAHRVWKNRMAQRIADTLKKAEEAGISEVILYVSVGLKPHAQVKEEMVRFMAEVAPAFEGTHRDAAA